MMHDYYGIGMGQMFFPGFGIIIQLIFLTLIIGIVFWVLKSGNIHSGKKESAKDILDKRLAKGDINIKKYKRLLKEIEK